MAARKSGKRKNAESGHPTTTQQQGPAPLGCSEVERRLEEQAVEIASLNEQLQKEIAGHRITENSLRQSEERFRLLYEEAPLGYQSLDADGKLIEVNPAWLELLGYSRDEVIGRWFGEFLTSESVEQFKVRFLEFAATGATEGVRFNMVRKDGAHILVEIDGRVGSDEEGRFRKAHCVLRDVPEWARDAGTIQESEERFRMICLATRDYLYDSDFALHKSWRSDAYYEAHGQPEDGENYLEWWKDRLHPTERDDLLNEIDQLIQGKETVWSSEYRFRRVDGSYANLLNRAELVRNPDGTPQRIVGAVTDVTQQRRVEEAYRTLVDNSLQGLLILQDEQAVFANPALADMLGYTVGQLLAMSRDELNECVHPDDRELIWRRHRARLRGESPPSHHIHRVVRKDGQVRWVEVYVAKTEYLDRPAVQIAFIDITERKEAEAMLRESEDKYRTLFETMAQGAFYQRADGVLTDCNSAVLDMFGMTRDQFLGKTSKDPRWKVIHEDGSAFPAEQHPSMEALRTGKPVTGIVAGVFNTRKEDYVWLSINAMPQFNNVEDRPYQVFVTLHDISERKRVEDELRHSEMVASTLLDATQESLLLLDSAGTVLVANETAAARFQRTAAEIRGTCVYDLMPANVRRSRMAQAEKVLRTGMPVEFEDQRADTIFHAHVYPMCAHNGPVEGIAIFAQDITERKRTVDALQKNERFLSVIYENSDLGIFVVSVTESGEYVYEGINPSHETLTGLCCADIIGKTPDDLVEQLGATSVQYIKTLYDECVQRREVIESEWYVPEGQAKGWWYSRLTPVIDDASDRVVTLIGSGMIVTKLKEAEKALRESEERFSSFMQHTPAVTFIKDTQTRHLYANAAFERELALAPGEWKGKTNDELFPPDVARQFNENDKTMVDKQEGTEFIEAIDGPTGPRYWITHKFLLDSQVDGSQLIGGVALEITERQRMQEQLHESERRFRSYFELGLIGMAITSVEKGWLEFNDTLCNMLGYSHEEFAKLTWAELTHPNDLQADEAQFNRVLAGETDGYSMEKRFIHRDGRIIIAEISASAIRKLDGSVDYFVALVQDITERRQAEEELKRQKYYLERAQELGSIGTWELDVNKNKLIWTDENYRVFGVPLGTKLTYETFLECLHPDDREYVDKEWQAALSGAPYDIEHRLLVDGKTKWVREKAELEFDANGVCLRGVGFTQDITWKKQSEEQLARAKEAAEAASRAKSLFLANMSHEVRTPMAAIIGYADLLRSHDWSPSERSGHLETIRRNANSLLRIINDVLDLSKIEAERIDVELTECSPQEIVEEVCALVQVLVDEKGLNLDVTYSHPLPQRIRTDRIRVRQILLNLVNNAIKFTERGGVTIRTMCFPADNKTAEMRFEVADTGIGISKEEIDHLFQPFTQADMSHNRRYGGVGLGLHISQRLAEVLGGRIEVESQPDVGSTFTLDIDVDLPRKAEPPIATDQTKASQMSTPGNLEGRILLADDVADMRSLMRLNLESAGLEVDLAGDGKTAIEKALTSREEGRPYNLILMDIQMPGTDGLVATQQLRQEGWETPIVALTAHAMTGDRQKCLTAGCDDYIPKPVADDVLFDTIARHLNRSDTNESATPSTSRVDGIQTSPSPKARLLQEFLGNLAVRLEQIELAFQSSDLPLLVKLAHQLKGTAGAYGFSEIAQTAQQIQEQAGEQEELPQLKSLVSELAGFCQQALKGRSDVAKPEDESPREV